MKTLPFFGFRVKLMKRIIAFRCFQTAPPKNLFCAPSLQAHYAVAGPASNCLMRPKQAQVSNPVPNCIFAIF